MLPIFAAIALISGLAFAAEPGKAVQQEPSAEYKQAILNEQGEQAVADAKLTPAELDVKYPGATDKESAEALAINNESISKGRLLTSGEKDAVAAKVAVAHEATISDLYWKGEAQ